MTPDQLIKCVTERDGACWHGRRAVTLLSPKPLLSPDTVAIDAGDPQLDLVPAAALSLTRPAPTDEEVKAAALAYTDAYAAWKDAGEPDAGPRLVTRDDAQRQWLDLRREARAARRGAAAVSPAA